MACQKQEFLQVLGILALHRLNAKIPVLKRGLIPCFFIFSTATRSKRENLALLEQMLRVTVWFGVHTEHVEF
jgi:hypothetical protein